MTVPKDTLNPNNKPLQSESNTPLLEQIKQAFSPEGTLSLYLLIGFAVLLFSSAIFAAIASDVTGNEPIVRFDLAIESAIHANTNPGLIQGMLVASIAGSQLIVIAAVVFGALLALCRNWRDLLLLVITVGGEELVNILFKNAFNRPRPIFSDPITLATGFSFPSGHAMGSMVFYGLIAYFLMRRSKPLLERILIVLIAALIVSIIGFSRVYLGLHYLSDVLGGYSAGLAWLAFTVSSLGLYRGWRQHRRKRGQSPAVVSSDSSH